MELTKNADYLLSVFYKEYLDRLADGYPKTKAKQFGSPEDIYNTFFAEWSVDDILETCRELSRAGMIDCFFVSGSFTFAELTSSAVLYMEKRFEGKVDKVLSWISKIKSAFL